MFDLDRDTATISVSGRGWLCQVIAIRDRRTQSGSYRVCTNHSGTTRLVVAPSTVNEPSDTRFSADDKTLEVIHMYNTVQRPSPTFTVPEVKVVKISINRAPVLTLWAAVVARRLGFNKMESLSLAMALAGLNAQSNGQRLGIFKPHEGKAKDARERKRGEECWIEIR